jgi:hypothetical protein
MDDSWIIVALTDLFCVVLLGTSLGNLSLNLGLRTSSLTVHGGMVGSSSLGHGDRGFNTRKKNTPFIAHFTKCFMPGLLVNCLHYLVKVAGSNLANAPFLA